MDNYFVIFWFMDVFEVETSFNGKKEMTHNQTWSDQKPSFSSTAGKAASAADV